MKTFEEYYEENQRRLKKKLKEAEEMQAYFDKIDKKYREDMDAINNSKPRFTRKSNIW